MSLIDVTLEKTYLLKDLSDLLTRNLSPVEVKVVLSLLEVLRLQNMSGGSTRISKPSLAQLLQELQSVQELR